MYQNGNSSRPNHKLSWRNISVWLKKKVNKSFWKWNNTEYVKILNNVSGSLDSGTLMAVMGASGSGKTTLLSTLCQRVSGMVSGDIQFDANYISGEQMKMISGFVPQHELVIGDLTVKEHLQFMARLKMNKATSNAERSRMILSISKRLTLNDCMLTRVSVLSGGEIKRLSIAIQLLTSPLFLFCDEPTTGLDSFTAKTVVETLCDVAYTSGIAIVCTIHQSTSGIFDMFDQVLFLTAGNMTYCGPTAQVCPYFETNFIHLKCPPGFNPAEYFLTQLAKLPDSDSIQNICSHFEKSTGLNNTQGHITTTTTNKLLYENDRSFHYYKKTKVNFLIQTYWLLWRCFINMKRCAKELLLKSIFFLLIAVILASMYWNITETMNQPVVQNIQGLIFLIITETYFTYAYSVMNTFPEELPNLLREICDGTYDPGPYYIAKAVSQIPIIIVETFFYSIIIFWSVGLEGGVANFFLFYVPVMFCAISAMAYGFVLSTTFESVETATLVAVVIDFVTITYSGVYLNISHLPWYSVWLPYISQFYYGIETIAITQWNKVDHIICENPELPCFADGDSVLAAFGFHPDNYGLDLLALCLIAIVCHTIGLLTLRWRCKNQPVY